MRKLPEVDLKPVVWMASALDDLKAMPRAVRRGIGVALDAAQRSEKAEGAKPLRGFSGAGVLEVVEDYHTDAYRAVYTVKFAGAVYVLH